VIEELESLKVVVDEGVGGEDDENVEDDEDMLASLN